MTDEKKKKMNPNDNKGSGKTFDDMFKIINEWGKENQTKKDDKVTGNLFVFSMENINLQALGCHTEPIDPSDREHILLMKQTIRIALNAYISLIVQANEALLAQDIALNCLGDHFKVLSHIANEWCDSLVHKGEKGDMQ